MADAITTDDMTNRTPIGLATMSRALPEAKRYHEWVYRSFGDLLHGRILEVGVGYGIYTPKLLRHGSVVAADIDPECLRQARKRFAGQLVECVQLDLEREADFAPLRDAPVDCVVCLNVLEHIGEDAQALQHLANVLKPGGKLILYVPAMPILFGTMDESAGHYRRYTRQSLGRIIENAGLTIVRARYQNAIGALGWWYNGRIRKERNLSADGISAQIRLFDRYVLPLTRVADVLTHRFFGQSVLIVGEKRAK